MHMYLHIDFNAAFRNTCLSLCLSPAVTSFCGYAILMTHHCKEAQARAERAQLCSLWAKTEKRLRHGVFLVDHFKLLLFTDLPFCSLKTLPFASVLFDLCNLIADY